MRFMVAKMQLFISLLCVAFSSLTQARNQAQAIEPIMELEEIQVQGRATNLTAVTASASQGVVGQSEFSYRPLARVGELVEVIPGALATQHSGSGKANQYFLRGFNLDHGTDFSVTVDGIPMNMPGHAHGQGYLDLNSVIPELVNQIDYGKGAYYTETGDFSSAGYARMHSFKSLPQGLLKFTGGEYDYYRLVLANSHKISAGDLLYAGEFQTYNGVWQRPEELRKYNGLFSYHRGNEQGGFGVYAKAYHARWNASNQIPQRAIDNGWLSLYGSMDNSDGGVSSRYSVSADVWHRDDHYKNQANLYAVYSDLNLYSNFTGYLDNPAQGDQIHQSERRVQIGANAEHTWFTHWLNVEQENSFGIQIRHDEVMGLALNRTHQRDWLRSVRNDDISQTSVGLYLKNQTHWLKKFRSIAGLRADFYDFNVKSHTLSANSGSQSAALLSPKLSLIFGPWLNSELFINLGYGHHSNDARGTTLKVDPVSNTLASTVTPLVWSRGGEVGMRSQMIDGLTSTFALWWLQMNSELVFVGDAGSTEPSGRSERYGLEWSNYYQMNDWLTLDADLALTRAHYTHVPSEQRHIPNSVGRVVSAGAVVKLPSHFFTTIRLRHFGQMPLNEAGSFYAGDTTLLNWSVGYQHKALKLELDLFNLLNSHHNDIAYAYESRLQHEALGVDGVLKHPVEPRMLRLSATLRF